MENITNKEIATEFLLLCAAGDSEVAFQKYAAPAFRHHNAYFKGDAETLMKAMKESAIMNPQKTFEIKHVIAEGNLVAFHSHFRQEPSSPGMAVMHLFRFEDGKIAEMWDFAQTIPSEPINVNGMF
jgi:predicted SnoaL-like aldol condensation-catalyzing enzyme